ncbi:hypothetical protein HETIRDRAFT_325571 [Heterobasidion irregulare TC 32-1]|uniref:Uncharacterized protein n=1 Tax=Heterobasidion irregulare (strain TC 32-1) TaxID=747525 RepID=W4JVT2_HETIT|nr:uncharacterized protein HETIRDRAFT_325571 [Heterobasidion irregulare TC 32-1]ETW77673.1 hypothetical protein HETIRDRAFT_325571 [Heterobasidion irregulare TC 32-1]
MPLKRSVSLTFASPPPALVLPLPARPCLSRAPAHTRKRLLTPRLFPCSLLGGEDTTTLSGTLPPDAFFSGHAHSTLRTAAHASHERTLSSASGYAHHHVAGTAKSTTSPTKQRYVADAHGLEIVKKIRQGEVELRDRTIVLCDIKVNVRPARFAKLRAITDAKKPGKAPTAIPAVSGLKRLRGRHRGGAGERGGGERGRRRGRGQRRGREGKG